MDKLDLHYTRHHLVRPMLIRFTEDHWGREVDAEIITGNSNTMKDLVKEVLDEYKLNYTDGSFDGVNLGFIRVEI